jgi:hypothetical protein
MTIPEKWKNLFFLYQSGSAILHFRNRIFTSFDIAQFASTNHGLLSKKPKKRDMLITCAIWCNGETKVKNHEFLIIDQQILSVFLCGCFPFPFWCIFSWFLITALGRAIGRLAQKWKLSASCGVFFFLFLPHPSSFASSCLEMILNSRWRMKKITKESQTPQHHIIIPTLAFLYSRLT